MKIPPVSIVNPELLDIPSFVRGVGQNLASRAAGNSVLLIFAYLVLLTSPPTKSSRTKVTCVKNSE